MALDQHRRPTCTSSPGEPPATHASTTTRTSRSPLVHDMRTGTHSDNPDRAGLACQGVGAPARRQGEAPEPDAGRCASPPDDRPSDPRLCGATAPAVHQPAGDRAEGSAVRPEGRMERLRVQASAPEAPVTICKPEEPEGLPLTRQELRFVSLMIFIVCIPWAVLIAAIVRRFLRA